MVLEVDLIREVVLVVDGGFQVVDAFEAVGKTRHELEQPAAWYTLRSLVVPAGHCAVCGNEAGLRDSPCSSSGGYHALAGMLDDETIPNEHKAEFRNIPLRRIDFEDLDFYCEPDNLFPIAGIEQGLVV